jgi:hypothetical protein
MPIDRRQQMDILFLKYNRRQLVWTALQAQTVRHHSGMFLDGELFWKGAHIETGGMHQLLFWKF